jgi:hypothetical protein
MNTSGPPLSPPNAPARLFAQNTLKGRIQSVKKTRCVSFIAFFRYNVDAVVVYKYFNRLVGWVRLIQESGAKWAYTVRGWRNFWTCVCAREYDLILCALQIATFMHASLA